MEIHTPVLSSSGTFDQTLTIKFTSTETLGECHVPIHYKAVNIGNLQPLSASTGQQTLQYTQKIISKTSSCSIHISQTQSVHSATERLWKTIFSPFISLTFYNYLNNKYNLHPKYPPIVSIRSSGYPLIVDIKERGYPRVVYIKDL